MLIEREKFKSSMAVGTLPLPESEGLRDEY